MPGRRTRMRTGMMAEMRRWLSVSVSRVTLEDESAPGVSSSFSSALRMLNANHGRDKKWQVHQAGTQIAASAHHRDVRLVYVSRSLIDVARRCNRDPATYNECVWSPSPFAWRLHSVLHTRWSGYNVTYPSPLHILWLYLLGSLFHYPILEMKDITKLLYNRLAPSLDRENTDKKNIAAILLHIKRFSISPVKGFLIFCNHHYHPLT